MSKLARIGQRFETSLTVIEGGRGVVKGIISESDQSQIPSFVFLAPRHLLRTQTPTAVRTGLVVRTPAGQVYIVGENGPSEHASGTLWQSFRLFEATKQVAWVRRTRTLDPVAQVEREGPPTDMGLIWAAVEPTEREAFDRKLRTSMEQARIITGRPIQHDDTLDGKKVIRSDQTLGVYIAVIT